MVYKKYIKRGDKLYGPYYYHSRRINGKVISEYHGPEKKIDYKKFIWIFLGIFLITILIYGLISFEKKITGQAILNLDANYQEGQSLEGNLRLVLREGELIPASSKIVFETSEQKYEYNLKDIVLDELVEGDFYVGGSFISGNGLGYGIKGIAENSPIVYFTLSIYSSSAEEPEEPVIEENVTEEEIPEEEPPVEENQTEEEPAVEEPVVEETSPITGGIISNLFKGVSNFFLRLTPTGQVSLEIQNRIDVEVSVGNDFIFELSEDQTAEIVPGSVRTDSKELPDDTIELDIVGDKVIIITDYSEIEQGFGEDYLGFDEKEISIDLSKLDLVFEQGELKVSLVYNAEELISMTTFLETGEVIAEEEPVEEPEEKPQNITLIIENRTESNITLETVEAVLTYEEKAILTKEFGNASVEITEAEEKNNRLIVKYELEDYWRLATYDISLSQEDLEAQMEADKIKWLKDIVKSLTKEESSAEERDEFLGNYSI